jgi:predicted outer membrane protein
VTEKPATRLAVAAALAAALGACASTPPPTEQVAAARAMVSQAQPVASRDGALELHTAQTKLARAEQAMERGDHREARIFAEQAEVDAKYAWTVAENARAQRAAAEVDRGIRALREELERGSR